MRIRDIILAGATLAMAGSAAVAPAANAATGTACTTSTVHSHSVTSRGTVSDRVTVTERCGKAYQAWAHGWTHSYTGASSTWHSYKDGRHCPGHWTMVKVSRSVSKSGTVRNTVTDSSGSC